MNPISPIRSTSPLARPKIIFNYPITPMREKPVMENYLPHIQQYPIDKVPRASLKLRTQPSQYMIKKDIVCLTCNKQVKLIKFRLLIR